MDLNSLSTNHGNINFPVFLPVATRGVIKNLNVADLKSIGAEIILSNVYHLRQRPGIEIIKKSGGLHNFIGWPGPILTDSGGFQVFSLSRLRNLGEQGVEFISELDGKKIVLTPNLVMRAQKDLGSDIAMVLDVCTPHPCPRKEAEQAVRLTLKWAKICRDFKMAKGQKVFGIIQGAIFKDLREYCLKELLKLDFDGYAIGGECGEDLPEVLDMICPLVPKDKPLYLMGIGKPQDIRAAVKKGVHMFDCVLPTREARHGRLYIDENNYINITNSKYQDDFSEIFGVSKAYLHHLFKIKEPLGQRLASLHNLKFLLSFMKSL